MSGVMQAKINELSNLISEFLLVWDPAEFAEEANPSVLNKRNAALSDAVAEVLVASGVHLN